MRALIIAAVFTSGIVWTASSVEPPTQLPSEQQVLTFIGNTIEWYRQLPTSQRIGSEPADLFFLEDNRPTAIEIVRLSFQFGKAVAAIKPPQSTPVHPETKPATPADREVPYLLSIKNKLGASAQRSGDRLQSLLQAKLAARAPNKSKLDAEITEMRVRIELLNAISAGYQNLADFVLAASADSNRAANMAALIEDLQRTVPDVSADGGSPRPSNIPAAPRAPYGIMDTISRVSALSRKEHAVRAAIERTNVLMMALQKLRSPYRQAFLNQLTSISAEKENLDDLKHQQSVLAGVVAQLQIAAPAVGALIKQETLLNLYRSHLTEWHSEIRTEYRAAWKALLTRFGVLVASIATLFGINIVVRRLMAANVRIHDRRQALLVGERVLFGLAVIAMVLFAFAFDPGSLATFLGLLSAGLAVGLRDVLLAVGGRMVLARRLHTRVGEQVEVAGVKGQVNKLGLMEFSLNEIDAAGRETGREVFFANSFVFVSPATPLFRRIGAPSAK